MHFSPLQKLNTAIEASAVLRQTWQRVHLSTVGPFTTFVTVCEGFFPLC